MCRLRLVQHNPTAAQSCVQTWYCVALPFTSAAASYGACHHLSSALLSGLLLPHHSLPLAEMFVGKDINLTTIQNYFNSVAIHGDKMNVFQRSASTKQRLRLGNETQATETEV